MAIIAKHYPDLLKQCADNYKDVIYMSQTVEDLLHKAIIKCLEIGLDKVTEEAVYRISKDTVQHS
ncbi:hypothetical protein NXX23_26470 [Bacteroides ovatus]|nr:hypothetical protein [Bacteroides ovatus]